MKAWVERWTGMYFQTRDNIEYSPAIATRVKPLPDPEATAALDKQKAIDAFLAKLPAA